MAAVKLGQSFCSELSPGDTTIDLPLAEDCPASSRVTLLPIDTTTVPDGTHRLELTVTDGAGNATVRGFDLKVLNHPPDQHPDADAGPAEEAGRHADAHADPGAVANVGVLRGPQAVRGLAHRLVQGRRELPRGRARELHAEPEAVGEAARPQEGGDDRHRRKTAKPGAKARRSRSSSPRPRATRWSRSAS